MKRLLLAVSVLALTLFCGNAHAAFVFNNFGPSDTFNINDGYVLNPTHTFGMKFTASGSGTLSQINLALSSIEPISAPFRGPFAISHSSSVVTVEFYANNSNTIGTLLSTGITTIGGDILTTHPASVALMSATSIVSGTDYWVVAKSTGMNAWNWTSPAIFGRIASSVDGGSTYNYSNNQPQSTFSVQTAPTSAVPEPSSLMLMSLGGLAFVARKLRRTKPTVA